MKAFVLLSYKDLYMNVHINFVCNSQKQERKCSSTGEWINTIWYLCPYYGILISNKRSELYMSSTTWMNLKIIMLKRRGQTQKSTYCMLSFTCNSRKRTHLSDRKQINGCLEMRKQKAVTHRNLWRWWIGPQSWSWWLFHGCVHMSKCIKFHSLGMFSLWYVTYISDKSC